MRVIISMLMLPALALASTAISSTAISSGYAPPPDVMSTSNIDMDTVTVIVTVPAYASTVNDQPSTKTFPADSSLNTASTISIIEPPNFTSLSGPTGPWPIEVNGTLSCPTVTTPGSENGTITLTSTIFHANSSATMTIDHTESMTSSAVTTQSTGGAEQVMKLGSLALVAGGLVAALV